ncbi:MAG: DUF1554 domain-containing protein [Myxococcota bacterium]
MAVAFQLSQAPVGAVSLGVSVTPSSEAQRADGALPLTFDQVNWSEPQFVTVQGVDDNDYDGNQPFTLRVSYTAGDACYVSQSVTLVGVNHNDDFLMFASTLWTGNLGGPAGADAKCAGEAAEAPLPSGTYRAMLVDGTTRSAQPALNWVLQPSSRYYDQNSVFLFQTDATGRFDFGDDEWTNALSVDTMYDAWTGLNADWTTHADTCNGWASEEDAVNGRRGSIHATDATAISSVSARCNDIARLICVMQ